MARLDVCVRAGSEALGPPPHPPTPAGSRTFLHSFLAFLHKLEENTQRLRSLARRRGCTRRVPGQEVRKAADGL